MIPTPQEAWNILIQYNEGEFHQKHGRIVGDVMKWYAQELGYGEEADFWEAVGILHDLDYEKYPDQHCIKSQEMMREMGMDERLIHATASHGFGITVDIKPEHEMEKVLFATDELTGLIGAAAMMRPSKSVKDMEVKSLKKKYKDKRFAAGCSRDVIEQGAGMLGWELDALLEKTLQAMKDSNNVD
ncbi:MAG: hydrolase [Clostridiales bacterium]|nr:hydrolase [Clostridiales bacterium]